MITNQSHKHHHNITITTTTTAKTTTTTSPYLRVSSAPAETRVEVSGDRQVCKTLSVWPINSATRVMAGYLGSNLISIQIYEKL